MINVIFNLHKHNTLHKSTQKEYIRRHKMSVHGSAKYFYDQCDFKATLKIYITKHKKSAHGTAAFSSQQCEFIATQKSYNKRHEKSVQILLWSMWLQDSCNQCEYRAKFQSNLKSHISIVHENVKFPYNKCDFKGNTQGWVNKHQKAVHEGVKYQCEKCDFESS